MKLQELYEAPSVSVTVEYEWEDPKSEEGESHMINVECKVTTSRDPYGTGDSPTEHEVEFKSATFKDTGKPFNVDLIPEKDWEWIDDKAIRAATR